jgi:hypothetical protein
MHAVKPEDDFNQVRIFVTAAASPQSTMERYPGLQPIRACLFAAGRDAICLRADVDISSSSWIFTKRRLSDAEHFHAKRKIPNFSFR